MDASVLVTTFFFVPERHSVPCTPLLRGARFGPPCCPAGEHRCSAPWTNFGPAMPRQPAGILRLREADRNSGSIGAWFPSVAGEREAAQPRFFAAQVASTIHSAYEHSLPSACLPASTYARWSLRCMEPLPRSAIGCAADHFRSFPREGKEGLLCKIIIIRRQALSRRWSKPLRIS